FFKKRSIDPGSYMSMIRHKDLDQIERDIAEHYTVRAEYMLGVEDEKIFESNDPFEAALYSVVGEKRF
ncbi:MAG: hypothetical protein PHW43_10445, partial [Syntrophales bacterium]|nr:hypothetical protein [Syntrophales bacterium]